MKEYKESLIDKISRLYTEIFLVALHNRIHSYHPFSPSNNHHEISGALHGLIDEIVNEVSRNYSAKDYKDVKSDEIARSLTSEKLEGIQSQSTKIGSMTRNGLSLYLINRQAQEKNVHMSEKLQLVVWDHVHSAHRLAMRADGDTAKLHADIACNAMKALSCYMPVDEYNKFFNEINGQISLR